jgi:hypothetical protein
VGTTLKGLDELLKDRVKLKKGRYAPNVAVIFRPELLCSENLHPHHTPDS